MHLNVILILALLCRMMLYECLNYSLITDLVSSICKKKNMIILIRVKKGVSTLMLITKTVRIPEKVKLNCPKMNVMTECLNVHDQCGPKNTPHIIILWMSLHASIGML